MSGQASPPDGSSSVPQHLPFRYSSASLMVFNQHLSIERTWPLLLRALLDIERHPKERPLQEPFLISTYQTRQTIEPHLRPIADIPPNLTRLQQAGDAEVLAAALQTTGRRGIRHQSFLIPRLFSFR